LGTFPEIGTRRDQLFPGLRARPVERHIVFYRIEGNRIEVIRIPHKRADAGRHLQS
jgi:toxin ParE1/3/4